MLGVTFHNSAHLFLVFGLHSSSHDQRSIPRPNQFFEDESFDMKPRSKKALVALASNLGVKLQPGDMLVFSVGMCGDVWGMGGGPMRLPRSGVSKNNQKHMKSPEIWCIPTTFISKLSIYTHFLSMLQMDLLDLFVECRSAS